MHANRGEILAAVALSAVLLMPVSSFAWQKKPDADNTRQNQRDRAKSEPTADQGKNNATDLQLAKKVRQALVGDKSLSTYAHNLKVIAQGGKVTLKGPVHSEAEKTAVEQKASEVAGPGNVNSEITVKAAAGKKGS
jgi:hyperosmotically inducible periplasmic protein